MSSVATQQCLVTCPGATYSVLDASNLTSCIKCPTLCSGCLSASVCSVCSSGAFLYQQTCYSSCPAAAPFAFSGICQTCNVESCLTCSGLDCLACANSKLLIGTSLCLASCSANQVYNSQTKTCDTVVTPTDGGGGTTTTTVNGLTDIRFIPLPFFIVLLVCSVLVGIMHFRGKMTAVPIVYGLAGGLLTLSNITTMAVAGSTSSLTNGIASAGLYILLSGQILVLTCNVLALVLWFKKIRG